MRGAGDTHIAPDPRRPDLPLGKWSHRAFVGSLGSGSLGTAVMRGPEACKCPRELTKDEGSLAKMLQKIDKSTLPELVQAALEALTPEHCGIYGLPHQFTTENSSNGVMTLHCTVGEGIVLPP